MKRIPCSALLAILSILCLTGCVTGPAPHSASAATNRFYFAQITDIHCCDADHLDRLAAIVEKLNLFPRKLEFVVVTGDIRTAPDNEEAYGQVKPVLAKLTAPVHVVAGNHDIAPPDTERGAATFKEAFGPIWYTAEHHGVVFVFTFAFPYFNDYVVDGVDPLAWTRSAIERARGKPVIVVQHDPPVEEFYGNEFHAGPPLGRVKLWSDLLNSNKVQAVIAGHFHGDELRWLGNVPIYVCPSVASYWGHRNHYRIYEYNNGRISSYTEAVEPKPRARGVFSAASASTEGTENSALAAVDGNPATRWESRQQSDPEWLDASLREPREIREVRVRWETASAKEYDVQVPGEGTNWTTVAAVTNGVSGEDRTIRFEPVTTAVVRIYGRSRTTEWGYSIWELDVW